jgi:excisionase family DNA binding protein
MNENGRRWLSVREAASRLGLHPVSVYRLACRGELPVARLGGRLLIDWRRLEEVLERQTEKWTGRVR